MFRELEGLRAFSCSVVHEMNFSPRPARLQDQSQIFSADTLRTLGLGVHSQNGRNYGLVKIPASALDSLVSAPVQIAKAIVNLPSEY